MLSTTAPPRSLVAQPFDPDRLTLQGTPQPISDRLPCATTRRQPGVCRLAERRAGGRSAAADRESARMDGPRRASTRRQWSPRASLNEFALASDERRVVARASCRMSDTRLWLFEEPSRRDATHVRGRGDRPMWALDGRHIYFTDTRDISSCARSPSAQRRPRRSTSWSIRAFRGCHQGRPLPRVQVAERTPAKSGSNVRHRRKAGARAGAVRGNRGARVSRRPLASVCAQSIVRHRGLRAAVRPAGRPDSGVREGRLGPVWRDEAGRCTTKGREGLMAVSMTSAKARSTRARRRSSLRCERKAW